MLDSGRQWITVQLRNVSTDPLDGISVTLWPFNSYDIDVLTGGSHHFVKELAPQETTGLSFNVSADHTGWVYLHVMAWRYGDKTRHVRKPSQHVSWDSPYYELRVNEDAAEIQTFS